MANGTFGGGNGSTTAPYLVEDGQDFIALRNRLNAHYRQTQDIDLEGVDYSAPGTFTGSYEGNGFKIKNVRMNRAATTTGVHAVGLFSTITPPAVIQNVHVVNGNYSLSNNHTSSITVYMGGIVARINAGFITGNGPINNCSFQGSLTVVGRDGGARQFGGIVGYYYDTSNTVTIKNCTVNANITTAHGSSYGFGISSHANCYNCSFTGSIMVQSEVHGIADANCYDCSVSNATLESTNTTSGGVWGIGLGGSNIIQRCSVTNSTLKSAFKASGIGGQSIQNCSVVNCTVLNTGTNSDEAAYGISSARSPKIERCLVKNCTITGPNATGMSYQYSQTNSATITDSAVIGGTIEANHTNGSATGVLFNRMSDATPTVDRSYCSANIISSGIGASGIMNTFGTRGHVKNSFFLGEYVKGLGARTSNIALICDKPLVLNTNNYALDTARIILE